MKSITKSLLIQASNYKLPPTFRPYSQLHSFSSAHYITRFELTFIGASYTSQERFDYNDLRKQRTCIWQFIGLYSSVCSFDTIEEVQLTFFNNSFAFFLH